MIDTQIIDGKLLAEELCNELKTKVSLFKNPPQLHAIIVGTDPASKIYVKRKEDAATKVGIKSVIHELPETVTEEKLLKLIHKLNDKPCVNGILVQLPLPKHIDYQTVVESINPDKDVDCFHPLNVGKLIAGKPSFIPCTPKAVLKMIRSVDADYIQGSSTLVIGRSLIVGTPTSLLMTQAGATVTVAHSHTRNLRDLCEQAEIVIVAVGKPNLIRGAFFHEGAIVIDVGINRLPTGKIVGDVCFNECIGKVGAITPVPGGVGPMTIACLLENTVEAYERNQ